MKTNIVGLTIGAAVAIIVLASVLVPVVDDAQKNIGDEVTFTNPLNSINQYHYDYVDDMELVATYSDGAWHVSIDGSDVPPIGDFMLLCLSETVGCQFGANGQSVAIGYATDPFSTAPNFNASKGAYTIAYHDKKVKVSNVTDGVLYESECGWFVTVVDGGEYIARNGNPTNFYTNGTADGFILYSGGYTTGDLDTFYAYGNGELAVAVDGYHGAVNFNRGNLVDNTTDVYQVNTINVTITDGETSETFTPYRCLVKETIHGHEAGGAAYSLIGVLPTIVIVAVLVGIIGIAVRGSRD